MGTLKPWAQFTLLVVAHLLAVGLGAVVVQALEGPAALQLQGKLKTELATFQAEYGVCLPRGVLEELLGVALKAQAHGVSSLGNGSVAGTWDLPSALLFTASILTTPGYGHMAPLSTGKAFCVICAALGLPVSLELTAALRHRRLPVLSRSGAWVAVRWQLAAAWAALLQAMGLLLVAGIFVLLPALVLWGLQGDCTLLEAIYFCFSSLSTIGLGDLLPGRGHNLHPVVHGLGQLVLLGYLLLGLLAMLLVVEAFSELPQVRAMLKFFVASGPLTTDDHGSIISQDELSLSTLPPTTPASEWVPAC
ncbi:LOW QUALITY PROTEIN: potassium channel subfamily K member 7 [Ctenodactylus gundi]